MSLIETAERLCEEELFLRKIKEVIYKVSVKNYNNIHYNGGIKLEKKKKTKKLELPISPKTGEPLKQFIKPKDYLLRSIILVALGILFWWMITYSWFWGTSPVFINFLILLFSLIEGCLLISRVKLSNKYVLGHQIIVSISDFFMLFYGFCCSIILWSISGLLTMVLSVIVVITSILGSIIHCLYWLVKLEKYKVKN